jgi:3-oxoacyl-[acyl-carrier protein] reductase
MSSTSGKVALVTGSATGVGRAAAVRFAREGFAVVVNYSRSEREARATVAEVERHRVPALLCQANVADDGEVRNMVERCRSELGGVDVLVNNAGTTHFIDHADLDALTDEVWDDILGVNLKGTFYCCRAALPALQEREGCIVNVTSVAGLQARTSTCTGRAWAVSSMSRRSRGCRGMAAPSPTPRARRPSTA